MKVVGPNGHVIDVVDAVATGLVGDGSRGFKFVGDEPPAPVKRGPGRPRKTAPEK